MGWRVVDNRLIIVGKLLTGEKIVDIFLYNLINYQKRCFGRENSEIINIFRSYQLTIVSNFALLNVIHKIEQSVRRINVSNIDVES
jgi:hypothetical protein